MTKAPGEPRPFSWKGRTGGFIGMQGSKRGLLRKWNSSHPIVDTIASIVTTIVVVAAIAATPIVVAVVGTVSETIYAADESQLALDLRPV